MSATLPDEASHVPFHICFHSFGQVLALTQDFMKKPFRLLVKRDEMSLHGIQQYYVFVEKDSIDNSWFVSRWGEPKCLFSGAMEI